MFDLEQLKSNPPGDRFEIKELFSQDRGSTQFIATDLNSRSEVLISIGITPFVLGSKEAHQILQRIDYIQSAKPQIQLIIDSGFTRHGFPYVVINTLNGRSVSDNLSIWEEKERRWALCLRLIEQLHALGLSCGDLSHKSFWLDRSGNCQLVSLLGTVPNLADEGSELIAYRAPEQGETNVSSFSADVFAMGVLGYSLMTGRYPYIHKKSTGLTWSLSSLKPIGNYAKECPTWLEAVVLQCLHPDPKHRYRDVAMLRNAIDEARHDAIRQNQALQVIAPSSSTPLNTGQRRGDLALGKNSSKRRTGLILALSTFVCAGMVTLLLITFFYSGSLRKSGVDSAKVQTKEDLLAAVSQISQERVSEIERLKSSDDPLAHHLLIQKLSEESDFLMKRFIVESILDRAWRNGLSRSVDIFRKWMTTLPEDEGSFQNMSMVLGMLDASIPDEKIISDFSRVENDIPELALKFEVALALDRNNLNLAKNILLKASADSTGSEVADFEMKDKSVLAHMMANTEVNALFPEDLNRMRDQLTDSDLPWLLNIFASRQDEGIKGLAQLAMTRKLIPPTRMIFLELLNKQPENFSPELTMAMIRFASGVFSIEDVQLFGQSYYPDSAKVLLSVLVNTDNSNLLLETFDLVAGKSFEYEPSATLLSWVKNNSWDNRYKLAKLVGQFAFLDDVPIEDLKKEFANLDNLVELRSLIDLLIDNTNEKLVLVTLERYAGIMPLHMKLSLLRHPEAAVRKKVIEYIETNDAGALQFIKRAYDLETNQEVRNLYSKFWILN